MTPSRRRSTVLVVGLVALAIVTGGWLWPLARNAWHKAQVRRGTQELQAAWTATLAAPLDVTRSYVAVAGGSAGAWAELLTAAGMPAPAILEAPRQDIPDGIRLLVAPPAGLDVARLAAAGRAVIVIELAQDAEPMPDGAMARFGTGELLPLADAPVHALELQANESRILQGARGEALGTVRPEGAGVVVRLGLDLGAHLVRLRLGTPERAGRDHDGNGDLQPADLIPRAQDDLDELPWADHAVDALLGAIATAWPSCPLPRLRGLPAGMGSVVVLTSDQDYASEDFVELMASRLDAHGARATFMLTDPSLGLEPDLNRDGEGRAPELSAGAAGSLLADGFGLGVHPFPRAAADLTAVAARFQQRLGILPLVTRNHHLRWADYDGMPRAAAGSGLMLGLDLMPVATDGEPAVSFRGGSARPIRMMDAAGRLLPILQQPTVVDDYSLRVEDEAARSRAAEALGQRALLALHEAQRLQIPIVVNAHPMLHAFTPGWLDPLLDAPGVHVISAEDWLRFVVHQRQSRIALPACGRPVTALSSGVAPR